METGLKMIKNNPVTHCLILLLLLTGCNDNEVANVTTSMPKNNWSYISKVKTTANITDTVSAYAVYFNLRVTAAYRYSNIYVLFKIKDANNKEKVQRYEYKLAEAEGQWLGRGSGNLYAYKLPLLTNYHFTNPGNIEFEIEQNMRDNPLSGISDAGLSVERLPAKEVL